MKKLGMKLGTCAFTAALTLTLAGCYSAPAANASGQTPPSAVSVQNGMLVGANGMTLYMYDPDTGGTSTCYDKCATAWPPLLTDGAPTAAGEANAALLKTSPRTDGTTQVVYGTWPLYFWQKDAAPGDVTGQGVGGVWWVVGVDGQPIKTPAS